MLTYPKNFEGSITIIGEKGTVKIGGVAVNKIEKWEFEDYDDDDRIALYANYQPPNVYGFGHNPYYRNVIDVLLGKDVPSTMEETAENPWKLFRQFTVLPKPKACFFYLYKVRIFSPLGQCNHLINNFRPWAAEFQFGKGNTENVFGKLSDIISMFIIPLSFLRKLKSLIFLTYLTEFLVLNILSVPNWNLPPFFLSTMFFCFIFFCLHNHLIIQ